MGHEERNEPRLYVLPRCLNDGHRAIAEIDYLSEEMRSRIEVTLNLRREFNGSSIMRTLKNLLAVECVRQLHFIILKKGYIVFQDRQLRKDQ